jgi:hypothetical protein
MTKPDRIARALVDATLELYRRRLWLEVRGDAPFLVRVPGEEHPLVVSILGQERSQYGACLFRGPGAIARAVRWASGERQADHMEDETTLSATMEQLGEIEPELRAPLRAAGFQARREAMAPLLISKPAGREPRSPSRSEMRLMAQALRGILQVHDAGFLAPPSLGTRSRRILEIDVSEDPRSPATSKLLRFEDSDVHEPPRAPVDLPWDLAALPRLEPRWVLALPLLPGAIEGEPRRPRALIVFDEASEALLLGEVVLSGDDELVAEKLSELFRARGLPSEIAFSNEALQAALRPALGKLDIATSFQPDHPLVERLLAAMLERLEEEHGLPARRQQVPRTLAEWKAADVAFTARMFEAVQEAHLVTPRALARYFGSEQIAEEVETTLGEHQPFAAFVEWLAADYRPTRRSATFLEKAARARGWSETERRLIQARSAAELSIYRVVATEPGSTLDLEDLLSGRRATLHDASLSGCGLEGFFIPLRLFRAGSWTFCAIAGPTLGAFRVERALQELELLGLEPTPAGMRSSAHLVGRLWAIELRSRKQPTRLQNTDGDPLAFHTATFLVADPSALARELNAREDLDYDESDGGWSWVRSGVPVHGFGEVTRLGTLRILDDRLLLEVNSAERLARARGWLERLPGVSFERVTVREAGAGGLERDDTLPQPRPAPMDPELVGELRKMHLTACRRWLDLPVPALGNLTPRAACATPEGRRRVARMVRAMPPMGIPGGEIAAPCEELFAELGLSTEE